MIHFTRTSILRTRNYCVSCFCIHAMINMRNFNFSKCRTCGDAPVSLNKLFAMPSLLFDVRSRYCIEDYIARTLLVAF